MRYWIHLGIVLAICYLTASTTTWVTAVTSDNYTMAALVLLDSIRKSQSGLKTTVIVSSKVSQKYRWAGSNTFSLEINNLLKIQPDIHLNIFCVYFRTILEFCYDQLYIVDGDFTQNSCVMSCLSMKAYDKCIYVPVTSIVSLKIA